MASTVAVSDSIGIPDEEAPYAVPLTEVDDGSRPLVAQVADLALCASAHLPARRLEFPVTAGTFLAALPLPGQSPHTHILSAFERADAPPRDHQRRACIRGYRRLVDLAQINGRVRLTWGSCCLRGLNRHMEFITVVPDQFAGPTAFW
ncbi:MAG TPA: hypothetical protein VF792_07830 [Ktedonobacterales bacterium]